MYNCTCICFSYMYVHLYLVSKLLLACFNLKYNPMLSAGRVVWHPPRYWPQQLCWVSRTSTKQEEEKFQIVYLKWCICLFTNMELYFQLKQVSSNFETRYKCTYMYAKHIYMYNCTWRWPNLFEHLNLVNADGNQCFTGLLLP